MTNSCERTNSIKTSNKTQHKGNCRNVNEKLLIENLKSLYVLDFILLREKNQ